MRFSKINSLVLLITLIAFFLRVVNIKNNPPGFFADEASIGFSAYNLLMTGKDEYGQGFPLLFKALGEYKNPVFVYSSIPFIFAFGLSEFSVRLTAVVFGTLAIPLLFLVARHIFSEKYAFIAALTLAIMPWHIHFSRIGFELISFPTFFLFSWWLFLKGLKKSKYLYLSAVVWGITVYTYPVARLVVPIFLIALLIIYRKQIRRIDQVTSILIFVLFYFPLFKFLTPEKGLLRWNEISLFANSGNVTEFVDKFFTHYTSYFNPVYLFLKGEGGQVFRHSLSNFGLLYLWQAPLVIFSFIKPFRGRKRKEVVTLFLLLFLYPLGGALTFDSPVAGRSIIGVIPFAFLTAFGLKEAFAFTPKIFRRAWVILTPLIIVYLTIYLYAYHKIYPLYSAGYWGWQYGPKEIMSYFLENKNYYDEMLMEGKFNSEEIFLKFYDPQNICEDKCKTFDNLAIFDSGKKQLFAMSPELAQRLLPAQKLEPLKIIKYPNSQPAFIIGEIKTLKDTR